MLRNAGRRLIPYSTARYGAFLSRISYCSADATHDHVFAFIATNLNETMECHAFLCPKRKMAQTVTLTVAQAFNTAYEAWQLSQADPRIHYPQDKSPSLTESRTGTRIRSSRSFSISARTSVCERPPSSRAVSPSRGFREKAISFR